jgi:hypothetical protein
MIFSGGIWRVDDREALSLRLRHDDRRGVHITSCVLPRPPLNSLHR